jgi:curved DNA-binding protein CbpA
MAKTHYEVLGVKRASTAAEIRSAYRRIALKHHPDHSKDPASTPIFMAATESYEVLSDADKRRAYDNSLDAEVRRKAEQQRAAASRQASAQQAATRATTTQQSKPSGGFDNSRPLAAEIARLSVMFSRGQHGPAEQLARSILQTDPRQPIPYAVLGDLMRSRGNLDEAAKMYAYAAQFDPRNAVYQRRYEELLSSSRVVSSPSRHRIEAEERRTTVPIVGLAFILMGCLFVAFSSEDPLRNLPDPVSTWTVGAIFCLFLSGVTAGVSLSVGNIVDRFSAVATNTVGRLGPALALGTVAIVSFWAAALLYVILGFAQRAFNFSMSRFMAAVAGVTALVAVAATASSTVNSTQVLLWGGNLVYIGAICGWMIADSFR